MAAEAKDGAALALAPGRREPGWREHSDKLSRCRWSYRTQLGSDHRHSMEGLEKRHFRGRGSYVPSDDASTFVAVLAVAASGVGIEPNTSTAGTGVVMFGTT